MSRLSRDPKRAPAGPAIAEAAPIDVRVTGAGGASVGGVPVVAAAGKEIQHAVLSHLHRVALAMGHAVLATVHDERTGYVVPLRVNPDGSSEFAADPVRVAPPGEQRDKPTHVMHPVPEPVREAEPQASVEPSPTFPLRALPDPADPTPPGTVAAPTGTFGPPPVMDGTPASQTHTWPAPYSAPALHQEWPPAPQPIPESAPARAAAGSASVLAPPPTPRHDPALDPDPKPTPARGFDAVAEAVLGDGTLSAAGEGAALLAEPVARINEAVKAGRIEAASELAERTVAEASGTLGPEHPEVLRLCELTAYIAYLADEPVRSFRLSLDLARIHRRERDAEAAYGNIQSAATAWRAVRNPVQGLDLGVDLIALWSELTAEEGPAADEIEKLESARSRMTRLAERARTVQDSPGS
ncbi:tetratricopeptide repeat protein [Streptomyces luteolifulvus]|uniref:Tetratricopeptide repeat protein n=1 Tax=Streptomyces luteolifulvus TaxID=2615112 RepID=A0A6H9UXA0_9ACTN|nr:tetratricopeptide repeat protein [Streptomyces luteolifulvus]KAB1144115.1 tetratricopeptide repeat protein [Streptomyces luteolifulvus]